MFTTPLIALLTAAASASALVLPRQASTEDVPIKLVFPYSRGTSAATAANGPCQGFPAQVDNRTEFPLSGGKFAFTDSTGVTNLTISYATNYTSPSFRRFLPVIPSVAAGQSCFEEYLDFNNYGSSPGSNLTFGFSWLSAAGVQQYECADIVFVNAADFTTSLTDVCVNATTTASTTAATAASGTAAVVSGTAAAAASSGSAAASAAATTGSTSGAMGRFEVASGTAVLLGVLSAVAASL
ncbi:hypothetical protein BDY24DRAFT_77450 [Mrakia frigida]|uniref:copper acquisition factor BIM1-like domain-containing protein n=1 Tax=Mrakia frigida TaxID=29902 RepID=UPI003FCBF29B